MENKYLADYYSNYDEDGRLLRRYSSVEFLTTMRYIEKYLKSGDRILDIGAATGRYSYYLARKGHKVDAVELLDYHIEIFKQNMQSGDDITITKGNAMDLSVFADNTYDITLLFGPLYHLYNIEDKQQAIKEAIRVTKVGGIVFAAYIVSDSCILDEGFKRGGFDVAEFIADGLIDEQTFAASSKPEKLFELTRKEEIDELMSAFSVTRLHYVATDGYAYCMREAVSEMDEAKFELYLKYHFATCERTDLLGISSHSLDIFRKDFQLDTDETVEPEVEKEIAYYNSLPIDFDGFIDLPELSDGEIQLVCTEKKPADPVKNWLPSYEFLICKGSEKVGNINLRIGYGGGPFNSNCYYGGQIGYSVDEKHRGRGFAGRACKLLEPVAKAHGMTKLLITTDAENAASIRVCEKLGLRLVRTVRIPTWHQLYKDGGRYENIFEWDFAML